MFESEFLTSAEQTKDSYRRLISDAAHVVCQYFPTQPYSGTLPGKLADAISSDFLPARQCSSHEILETLSTVVSNSIAVSDPATVAHLHCPPLIASLAAEVVISALNQSMDSFDQAPIATIVEQKLVRWLCAEAGLAATADGTFTTGGSQSNYMGLLLARDYFLQKKWKWSAQKSGLPPEARQLRILCSEVAHFTVEKSAAQLGLGTDAVLRVAVDQHFCMSTPALRKTLDSLRTQNLFPMAIVATAGTTDFGSIDPLAEAAALAQSAGSWFHVDAAYGGALLFSPRHCNRLAGIEAADSIAIDFHKLFWQPIPCSAFLLRNARNFDFIKMHADYLNPELHEQDGIPNLVTTSLLTSRRFDALKLWISFQCLGKTKLGAMIERTVELAHYASNVVRNTPSLELICEPQLSTVVFRYVPEQPAIDADEINAKIRQHLFDRGRSVVGHTRVHNRQCLKFTCMNPSVTESQLENLIELIVDQGKELESSRDSA